MTGLSAARGPGFHPWASLRYSWKNSSLRSKLIVLITGLMLLTVILTGATVYVFPVLITLRDLGVLS